MLDYVTIHGPGGHRRWRFSGASRANTDDGRLYVSIGESPEGCTVSLFSNGGRSNLVALGTLPGNSGQVELVAQNASGLSASVELVEAAPRQCELDVFYACSDDLLRLQGEIAGFLSSGSFAGEPGFAQPCAAAKRSLDALLAGRGLGGLRFDSLAPLASPASHFALAFMYDFLAHREGEPAVFLAARHRERAHQSLSTVRLQHGGRMIQPFNSHITRA